MLTAVLLAACGLGLLTVAADQLVIGSGRVATRARIPPIVVGIVVIGIGTSTPEFLVSGLAAAQGNGGLAIGNLVGSNILNLTLILGIAALIRPVTVASSVVRREMPLTFGAMLLLAAAIGVGLAPVTGTILAVTTVGSLWLLVRIATGTADQALAQEVVEATASPTPRPLRVEVARTVAGLAGTVGGAQLLVVNAASVASRLAVPQVVLGFTLVALGTSLPELVTTIQAQRRGEPDLVVGNLLGSNLFNSVAGGAIVGLAGGGRTAGLDWPLPAVMMAVGLLTWALLYRGGGRLVRVEGGVLLLTYAVCLPLMW